MKCYHYCLACKSRVARLLIFDERFWQNAEHVVDRIRILTDERDVHFFRLPNHLRTDSVSANCPSASSRDLWCLTFCFFRHAAHRRNVRTAPTMMPKQYTRKRALRLRQNSLLKLVLNLRARSICEAYTSLGTRQKWEWLSVMSETWFRDDGKPRLKYCKLVRSGWNCFICFDTIRLRLRKRKKSKNKKKKKKK